MTFNTQCPQCQTNNSLKVKINQTGDHSYKGKGECQECGFSFLLDAVEVPVNIPIVEHARTKARHHVN